MKKRVFSPHFIIAKSDATPYLRRWYFTPWSDDKHKLKRKRLPNIYLHHILKSDDDRALHDHPWDNVSIILKGGYIEHVFAYEPVEGQPLPPIVQKRRRAGHIVRRQGGMAHRIELYREGKPTPLFYMTQGGLKEHDIRPERPCWSIFITWRKSRAWGFWTERNGVIGRQEIHRAAVKEQPAAVIELQTRAKVAWWMPDYVFFAWQGER